MRVGINGFGRIGRLLFRALWGRPGIKVVHVNDHAGDAAAAAHLLRFDSVHGRWSEPVHAPGEVILVGEQVVGYSDRIDPAAVPWAGAGVELVLECSGAINTPETLAPYFDQAACAG